MAIFGLACEPPALEAPQAIESGEVNMEPNHRNLFIIGGGSRPDHMMEYMLQNAMLHNGRIVVLPWASSEPDTSYFYFQKQLDRIGNFPSTPMLKRPSELTEEDANVIRNAGLIYITGGDQSRFMAAIDSSNAKEWIHQAHTAGCCVAGTSAGAAMMSEVMITGDENFESEYHSTYRQIRPGNGIYNTGLGLLENAIVDQHFIARSRYNRLLSAVCEYSGKWGFGIEESTALWVRPDTVEVVGDHQVFVVEPAEDIRRDSINFGVSDINVHLLMPGDKMVFK